MVSFSSAWAAILIVDVSQKVNMNEIAKKLKDWRSSFPFFYIATWTGRLCLPHFCCPSSSSATSFSSLFTNFLYHHLHLLGPGRLFPFSVGCYWGVGGGGVRQGGRGCSRRRGVGHFQQMMHFLSFTTTMLELLLFSTSWTVRAEEEAKDDE